MFTGIFDSIPDVDAATKQKLESSFKQSFGSKAFKSNIESMSAYLPDAPVAKGESWKINTPVSSSSQTNLIITYRLEDVTDKHYIVTGTGSMTPNEDSPAIEVNGVSMKQKMAGTNTITMKINKATGWVQESDLNQQTKGEIIMNKSEQMPDGMTIQMETSSIVRITE